MDLNGRQLLVLRTARDQCGSPGVAIDQQTLSSITRIDDDSLKLVLRSLEDFGFVAWWSSGDCVLTATGFSAASASKEAIADLFRKAHQSEVKIDFANARGFSFALNQPGSQSHQYISLGRPKGEEFVAEAMKAFESLKGIVGELLAEERQARGLQEAMDKRISMHLSKQQRIVEEHLNKIEQLLSKEAPEPEEARRHLNALGRDLGQGVLVELASPRVLSAIDSLMQVVARWIVGG